MTHISSQATSQDRMKTNPGRNLRARLEHILTSQLDEGDLRLLCIQLGIDSYCLPGENKYEKTKALIDLLERHGRIPELIRIALLLHPDIPWKKLLNISPYPSWMRRFAGRLNKSLPAIIMVLIICALFVFIPLSSANWSDILGVSGEIFTGSWQNKDCTHSHGFWKEHPAAWPVEEIAIGGVTYPKAEAIALLETPPKGDITYILAQQLIATKLNIIHGADPTVIEQYVADADGWLVEHPLGSNPKKVDRKLGSALAKILDLYNDGLLGPGHCLEQTGIISLFPMEKDLPPNPTVPPEDSPPIPKDNSGGEPISNETPIPTETTSPGEDAPPLPSSTPTEAISPSPTATVTGTPRLTPTPAPTQDPYATPTTETPRPTPTMAPTIGNTPTPTTAPTESATPTPTPLPPTLTPTPTEYSGPPGCTQGMEYWISHPEEWSLEEFQIGEGTYDQFAALSILTTNPQGDATFILAQGYITTLLNIASPADPSDIIGILEQAHIWFLDNPLGSAPKNPERKEGIQLAKALEEYNLGITGPGACELDIPTSTPTPTSIPSPSSTMTPTDTPTTTQGTSP